MTSPIRVPSPSKEPIKWEFYKLFDRGPRKLERLRRQHQLVTHYKSDASIMMRCRFYRNRRCAFRMLYLPGQGTLYTWAEHTHQRHMAKRTAKNAKKRQQKKNDSRTSLAKSDQTIGPQVPVTSAPVQNNSSATEELGIREAVVQVPELTDGQLGCFMAQHCCSSTDMPRPSMDSDANANVVKKSDPTQYTDASGHTWNFMTHIGRSRLALRAFCQQHSLSPSYKNQFIVSLACKGHSKGASPCPARAIWRKRDGVVYTRGTHNHLVPETQQFGNAVPNEERQQVDEVLVCVEDVDAVYKPKRMSTCVAEGQGSGASNSHEVGTAFSAVDEAIADERAMEASPDVEIISGDEPSDGMEVDLTQDRTTSVAKTPPADSTQYIDAHGNAWTMMAQIGRSRLALRAFCHQHHLCNYGQNARFVHLACKNRNKKRARPCRARAMWRKHDGVVYARGTHNHPNPQESMTQLVDARAEDKLHPMEAEKCTEGTQEVEEVLPEEEVSDSTQQPMSESTLEVERCTPMTQDTEAASAGDGHSNEAEATWTRKRMLRSVTETETSSAVTQEIGAVAMNGNTKRISRRVAEAQRRRACWRLLMTQVRTDAQLVHACMTHDLQKYGGNAYYLVFRCSVTNACPVRARLHRASGKLFLMDNVGHNHGQEQATSSAFSTSVSSDCNTTIKEEMEEDAEDTVRMLRTVIVQTASGPSTNQTSEAEECHGKEDYVLSPEFEQFSACSSTMLMKEECIELPEIEPSLRLIAKQFGLYLHADEPDGLFVLIPADQRTSHWVGGVLVIDDQGPEVRLKHFVGCQCESVEDTAVVAKNAGFMDTIRSKCEEYFGR